MCGIAGFAGMDYPALLRRMTRLVSYRGADDEGYFGDSGIGLGHRRLSIIDLSTGDQPIWSDDGEAVIVFNGEIYNIRELRGGLGDPAPLRSDSDTEVLLRLYEESGKLVRRIGGLSNNLGSLAYSKDGRFLGAGMNEKGGLRIYRTSDYSVAGEDGDYGDNIYRSAIDFNGMGGLVTISNDGFIRLYGSDFKLLTTKESA